MAKTIQEAGGMVDGGSLPTSQEITAGSSVKPTQTQAGSKLAGDIMSILDSGAKTTQAGYTASIKAAERVASEDLTNLAEGMLKVEEQTDESPSSQRQAADANELLYKTNGRKLFDNEDAQRAYDKLYKNSGKKAVASSNKTYIVKANKGDAVLNAKEVSNKLEVQISSGIEITPKQYNEAVNSITVGNYVSPVKAEQLLSTSAIQGFQSKYKSDKNKFIIDNELKDPKTGKVNWEKAKEIFAVQYGHVATLNSDGSVTSKVDSAGTRLLSNASTSAMAKSMVPLLGDASMSGSNHNPYYVKEKNNLANTNTALNSGNISSEDALALFTGLNKLYADGGINTPIPFTPEQISAREIAMVQARNAVRKHKYISDNVISKMNTSLDVDANGGIVIDGVDGNGEVEPIYINKTFIDAKKKNYIKGLEGGVTSLGVNDENYNAKLNNLVVESSRLNVKPNLYKTTNDIFSGKSTVSSITDFQHSFKINQKLTQAGIHGKNIFDTMTANRLNSLYEESLNPELKDADRARIVTDVNNITTNSRVDKNIIKTSGANKSMWEASLVSWNDNNNNTSISQYTSASMMSKAVDDMVNLSSQEEMEDYIGKSTYTSEGFLSSLAESFSWTGRTNAVMKMSVSSGKEVSEEVFVSGIDGWLKKYEKENVSRDRDDFILDSSYDSITKAVTLHIRYISNGTTTTVDSLTGDDIAKFAVDNESTNSSTPSKTPYSGTSKNQAKSFIDKIKEFEKAQGGL